MKLTKYEHACVVLEKDGQRLVIDPGGFTPSFGDLENITALVITHEHADHFDPKHVQEVIAHNPDVQIFTVASVAEKISHPKTMAVQAGQQAAAGPFTLEFFGDMHAALHPSFPTPHNIGVMVDNQFFYPGDAFTLPGKPVKVLAVPGGAPWMRTAEAMNYLTAVKPQQAFPTHTAIFSDKGLALMNNSLGAAAEASGVIYRHLTPTDSVDY